jgi:hypothetical protein
MTAVQLVQHLHRALDLLNQYPEGLTSPEFRRLYGLHIDDATWTKMVHKGLVTRERRHREGLSSPWDAVTYVYKVVRRRHGAIRNELQGHCGALTPRPGSHRSIV